MTRRARMGPIQTVDRGLARMAPGGRRSASESQIRPFSRTVGEMGSADALLTEDPMKGVPADGDAG